MSLISQHVADWPLTWMMHATIACIFALVAGRWVVADPRLRDALWKCALVLPLGTSLLSVVASPINSSSLDLAALARPHMPPALHAARISVQKTSSAAPAMVRVQDAETQWLRYVVLAMMLIPALAATSRLVQRRRRFWKDLRTRRPADERELCIDARAQSSGGRNVRISVSPLVASAAAVARHEICVSAAFTRLGRIEQQGVLAHEMAHLERRDLAWIAFADSVACALAVQPLVRMVARRFRRDAEFICDDIAVGRTGDGLAYVRALTVFASDHDPGAVAALAYGSSPIVQRAERVLGLRAARDRRPSARLATALLLLLLLSGLLSLPRVNTAQATRSVQTQVSVRHWSGSYAQTQINVTLDEP
jgi:beta-lactamase regulating signal transducer with metallopeptidase domain